jgi:hypothetical protein
MHTDIFLLRIKSLERERDAIRREMTRLEEERARLTAKIEADRKLIALVQDANMRLTRENLRHCYESILNGESNVQRAA